MEDDFDEYSQVGNDTRIVVEYNQIKDSNQNIWIMLDFFDKLSNCIYKADLINSVTYALYTGIKPENIVIYSQSIRISRRIDIQSNYNLDKGLSEFFKYGKLVSIIDNKKIDDLWKLYNFFKEINKLTYNFIGKREFFSKSVQAKACKIMFSEGFTSSLNYINLKLTNIEYIDTNVKNDYLRQVKNIYKKIISPKSYEDTNDDAFDNSINYKVASKALFETQEYNYYFFNLLNNLKRPIVGIYSPEKQAIQVLCSRYFKTKNSIVPEINLISYSHNSPFDSFLELPMQAYFLCKNDKREEELHKLKIEELQLKIAGQRLINQRLSNELDISNIKKANLIMQHRISMVNGELVPSDVSSDINHINNNTKKNYNKLLDTYGVQQIVTNMKSRIDFKL